MLMMTYSPTSLYRHRQGATVGTGTYVIFSDTVHTVRVRYYGREHGRTWSPWPPWWQR